jgi:hypothetical protein
MWTSGALLQALRLAEKLLCSIQYRRTRYMYISQTWYRARSGRILLIVSIDACLPGYNRLAVDRHVRHKISENDHACRV